MIEMKEDILLLRMILDIVSGCLKSVGQCEEQLDEDNFLNSSQKFDRSGILNALEQEESLGYLSNRGEPLNRTSDFSSARSSHRGLNPEGSLSSRGGNQFSFKLDLNKTQAPR